MSRDQRLMRNAHVLEGIAGFPTGWDFPEDEIQRGYQGDDESECGSR